jgi:hypothetical protein
MRARAEVAPLVLGREGQASLTSSSARSSSLRLRRASSQCATSPASRTIASRRAVPIALGASAQDRRSSAPRSTTSTAAASVAARRRDAFATIGECVVGRDGRARARASAPARQSSPIPTGSRTSPGVFPLELTVDRRAAARRAQPDDGAIFVDLRTMWSIRGLGHRARRTRGERDPRRR